MLVLGGLLGFQFEPAAADNEEKDVSTSE